MDAAERIRAERKAQGLPERITDPATLRRIAELLARPPDGGAS